MASKVMQYVGPKTNSDGQLTVNASEHERALAGRTNEMGRALRQMLEGWEAYAAAHFKRYEGRIGEDYVIGVYWAQVGLAIKRLLDGDAGGWDCGSLAANISEIVSAEGFKHDGYNLTDLKD